MQPMDSLGRILVSCNLPLFTALSLSLFRLQPTKPSLHLPLYKSPSTFLSFCNSLFSPQTNLRQTFQFLKETVILMAGSTKRHCFFEEDDCLASLPDTEAGYSGHNPYHYQHGFVSRTMGYAYPTSFNSSFRNLSVSSPRSGRFYDARFEDHQPHFLEACFLCRKPLGDNRDIFMYRGDTPFCSEECRQEQIEIDEAKEKNRNLSSSMKALRKKEQRKSSSPNKTQDYAFRTGTIAAA